MDISSRMLAERKFVPSKRNLVIAYTELGKFSLFLVEEGKRPEFVTDVDGILWKYDTLIKSGEERMWSMDSNIRDTIDKFGGKRYA